MSVERDLISKILRDKDLSPVGDASVTAEFFKNHDHREAFRFIMDHHRQYNSVPSIEAFKRNWPTYKITEPEDPQPYFVDELVKEHEAYILEDGLVKATDLFEDGYVDEAKDEAAATMRRLAREITTVKAVDITETTKDRLERYRAYTKTQGVLKGISTGFHMLDAATGGMQGGQLFTFAGPPKAGKSTMLLLSMIAASQSFYRPLFIGFEMSNEEQEERHDAIRAGVSHKRLRDGKLKAEEFQRLERMTRRLESQPEMIFVADPHSSSTLTRVSSLVEKYEPDVVYVDGMYLMEDEEGEAKNSSQALTNLTRGFKRMAQNTNLPFAITTQVLQWKMDRKRGVTTGSIGYSSSFGQDSDCLVGVEPTEDDDINKVKILDGRNVPRMEEYVRWDWETGVFEEVDAGEIEEEDEGPAKF